jgi:formate dehydrogenase subunit delta
MTPEHMVHMANQIALYFASLPHEEGVAGVADHLKRFWEKRMREQLSAYIAAGGAGLHKLVVEAVRGTMHP